LDQTSSSSLVPLPRTPHARRRHAQGVTLPLPNARSPSPRGHAPSPRRPLSRSHVSRSLSSTPSLPHHHAGRAARRQGAAPAGRGATRAAPPGSRAPAGRGAEGCTARAADARRQGRLLALLLRAPMVAVDGERKRRRPSRRTRSGGQRRPTTPSASHRGPVVPRAIATSADCASLDVSTSCLLRWTIIN
jgi:hypothetical protein